MSKGAAQRPKPNACSLPGPNTRGRRRRRVWLVDPGELEAGGWRAVILHGR